MIGRAALFLVFAVFVFSRRINIHRLAKSSGPDFAEGVADASILVAAFSILFLMDSP